jgi:hypothetical protein
MKVSITAFYSFAVAVSCATAQKISEINGNRFLSPYKDKNVTDVTGLVTAKGPSGLWIRSTKPDLDIRTSESIYVFSSSVGANLAVGDIITIDGKVSEYRSSKDYIYLTEIVSPTNVRKVSSGHTVKPLVIAKDTLWPPTVQYSTLDHLDVFNVPNNVSQISTVNPVLRPVLFGLDFWESINGELVTVKGARAISKPSSFRDTWVVGDWLTTGRNARGGLTMTDRGKVLR